MFDGQYTFEFIRKNNLEKNQQTHLNQPKTKLNIILTTCNDNQKCYQPK